MSGVWQQIETGTSDLPVQLATDPDGVPVFLSRDVWQNHILIPHPEMANYKDLILLAISSPVAREFENTDGQFVRAYADVPPDRLPSSSRLRVRVVVKYVRPPERDFERTGLVSSAYLVRWKVA